MSEELRLPDLGENIEGGDVVSVLVGVGDDVEVEQNVIELETDKAVVELPSPYSGKVKTIHVVTGDRLSIGDLVLTLEVAAGAEARSETASGTESASGPESEPESASELGPRSEAAPRTPAARTAAGRAVPVSAVGNGRPVAPAAPATRRLARELGVDLHQVSGTGPSGRITRDDVKSFVRRVSETGGVSVGPGAAANSGAAPALPDFSQWGEVEVTPLRGIRKATADAMSLAWRTIPHVTQFDSAEVTDLESARKRYETLRVKKRRPDDEPPGSKVTMTVLALKASVAALQRFPRFNSSIDMAAGQLITKRYYHIGIAVDTEHGLLVPVIRDVDKKSLDELAVEISDIADRARQRKIALEELRGGTFTITNLGGIGGTAFTPIVNHPEVAILGLARGKKELEMVDGRPQERLMLPLCLSYDHRVIDGADGARFLRYLAALLANPFQLMLKL